MKKLKFIISALLTAFFAACESGESPETDSTADLQQYTFVVQLENRIIPDSAEINVFTSDNYIVNTHKARNKCFEGNVCLFETAPIKYGDFTKITVYAHTLNWDNPIPMEFSSFAPMNKSNSWASSNYQNYTLNIYTSLASATIEYLLKEHNMPFAEAKAQAYENMKNFGFTDTESQNDPLPYIYTRYFISDSVFYSDFLEIQEAIRNGEWGDTLYRVRAADDLVRTYQNRQWVNVPGISTYNDDYIPNFWESTYGMEVCDEKHLGNTLVNSNKKSAFYDSIFECVKGAANTKDWLMGYTWLHWVLK